ncbi:MAG: hypothetical protein H7Y02_04310, partial [Candidatus Obscuribacterales bacterium]|nr:hypothetical protein [Steroidobacteraceae bacterium]
EEERRLPVTVTIDAQSLSSDTASAPLSRDQWLAIIEALKQSGKQAEADEEQRRMQAAFPESVKK